MFASHQIVIDAPHDVVFARLDHIITWGVLNDVTEAAYEGGLETLLLRVGPLRNRLGVSKLVRVHVWEPVRRGDTTTIGLRWKATGMAGDLFPVFDADLVLTPAGEERSRLELVGSYRPPLGRAGLALDRVILGRIASATIRAVLEGVKASLADPATEWAPGR